MATKRPAVMETVAPDTDRNATPPELAVRQTDLAFQRTRLAADGALMAVIRTALSLISFGFTIHQAFGRFVGVVATASAAAPRNYGLALASLGVVMLILGVVYHVWFMLGLRHARTEMKKAGLIYGLSTFPPSMTLVTALVLLLIGLAAIASMAFRVGPLG